MTAYFGGAAPEDGAIGWSFFPDPAGSLFATIFEKAGPENLVVLGKLGFWMHSTLVMLFLNLLPHSKHFHIITGIPNVFTRNLEPAKLPLVAPTSEAIGELVMKESEAIERGDAIVDDRVGLARIEDFT